MQNSRQYPYIFKKEGKKFNRVAASAIYDLNQSDVHHTLDKIEAMSDNYWANKKIYISWIVWIVMVSLLVLGAIGLLASKLTRDEFKPEYHQRDFHKKVKNDFDFYRGFNVKNGKFDHKGKFPHNKAKSIDVLPSIPHVNPKDLAELDETKEQIKKIFIEGEESLIQAENPVEFDRLVTKCKIKIKKIINNVKDENIAKSLHEFGDQIMHLRMKKLQKWLVNNILEQEKGLPQEQPELNVEECHKHPINKSGRCGSNFNNSYCKFGWCSHYGWCGPGNPSKDAAGVRWQDGSSNNEFSWHKVPKACQEQFKRTKENKDLKKNEELLKSELQNNANPFEKEINDKLDNNHTSPKGKFKWNASMFNMQWFFKSIPTNKEKIPEEINAVAKPHLILDNTEEYSKPYVPKITETKLFDQECKKMQMEKNIGCLKSRKDWLIKVNAQTEENKKQFDATEKLNAIQLENINTQIKQAKLNDIQYSQKPLSLTQDSKFKKLDHRKFDLQCSIRRIRNRYEELKSSGNQNPSCGAYLKNKEALWSAKQNIVESKLDWITYKDQLNTKEVKDQPAISQALNFMQRKKHDIKNKIKNYNGKPLHAEEKNKKHKLHKRFDRIEKRIKFMKNHTAEEVIRSFIGRRKKYLISRRALQLRLINGNKNAEKKHPLLSGFTREHLKQGIDEINKKLDGLNNGKPRDVMKDFFSNDKHLPIPFSIDFKAKPQQKDQGKSQKDHHTKDHHTKDHHIKDHHIKDHQNQGPPHHVFPHHGGQPVKPKGGYFPTFAATQEQQKLDQDTQTPLKRNAVHHHPRQLRIVTPVLGVLLVLLAVVPCCLVFKKRKIRKNTFDKVKILLNAENQQIYQRKGYVWNVECNCESVFLTKVGPNLTNTVQNESTQQLNLPETTQEIQERMSDEHEYAQINGNTTNFVTGTFFNTTTGCNDNVYCNTGENKLESNRQLEYPDNRQHIPPQNDPRYLDYYIAFNNLEAKPFEGLQQIPGLQGVPGLQQAPSRQRVGLFPENNSENPFGGKKQEIKNMSKLREYTL